MSVQEQLSREELATVDFPTLCSIPLRAEWFDDPEKLDAVIVRGTD
ncbi:hypothetical protein ACIA8G_09245 [Lentzea sp. NPDC051213]